MRMGVRETRLARFSAVLVLFSNLGQSITLRRSSQRSSTLRLGPRPVLTRSCLEEAGALSQDQPVQHISLLLALSIDDDLYVTRLREVWELILQSEGSTA